MKERHKAVPAVYLILFRNNPERRRYAGGIDITSESSGLEILLALRQGTGYQDGNWNLPSGHVERGELPKEALCREAKEEIGITIKPSDLLCRHTSYRTEHDETGDRVDFFFSVGRWKGEICNAEPHKCERIEWFSPYKLPENMTPHVREALTTSCFLTSRRDDNSYSEMGVEWLQENGVYMLAR